MNLTCQAPFTLFRPSGDLRITKIVVLPNQDGLLTDLWKFKSDWRTLLIVVAIKSSVHLWWLIWVLSATPPQLSNPSDLPCFSSIALPFRDFILVQVAQFTFTVIWTLDKTMSNITRVRIHHANCLGWTLVLSANSPKHKMSIFWWNFHHWVRR